MNDAWIREATRLHGRYLIEVVEHFGLCPWAVKARVANRLRTVVVLQTDEEQVEPSLAAMKPWASDTSIDVGFLLYPRLALERVAFDRFAARVRSAEIELHALGDAPFAMVAFHPEARPEVDDPERLIPFLRRTPDPCIQVVRVEVLNRVRGAAPEGTQFLDSSVLDAVASGAVAEPTVRERVSRANLETALSVGVEHMRQTMDSIRSDRDETYARLLRA